MHGRDERQRVSQSGLAFGYDIMGSKNSTVPVTTDNLPVTEGELKVNSKVFSYHGFLRLSFAQLLQRHGSIVGYKVPRPKLIPLR